MPSLATRLAALRGVMAAYLVIEYGFPRAAARAFARVYPFNMRSI